MAHPLADANARMVIGHRGDRAHAPENTIEGLTRAVEAGADAFEVDVRVTRDGVPVLMHDETVDRTTSGRGLLREMTFAELRTLDASRGASAWSGARAAVPTLEEVLDRFRGVPMVLDVKELAVSAATEQLVHKFGLQGTVVVGSDDAEVVARLYRSGLTACASRNDALMAMALSLVGIAPQSPDYSVLSLTQRFNGVPIPVLRMVAAARRSGIATHVWTVNDPAEAARLWHGGVSAIISDDPGAILRAKPR
ncbi:MAG: glycerophosphodiester phosphodiesterase family protein [Gemmatimonadota bacterium]